MYPGSRSMPWWIDRTRRIRHYLSRLEVKELELFGRSGLSVVYRHSVLVLATTGRKSGLTRKTPVTYLAYEDGFLIGGGAGGQKATPDWVLNLRANPTAHITINRIDTRRVLADEPTGSAREAAFEVMAEHHPDVRKFERWGERPLPLFILRPV